MPIPRNPGQAAPPINTSHTHWNSHVFDPDTDDIWTPEEKVEFITNLINNEFITQITENQQFITNIFQSDTYITEIKGQPNGVPSLDGSGKIPKGQINADYIDNPMEAAGDLIVGGTGTPTGYDVNRATVADGASVDASNFASFNDGSEWIDGNDGTKSSTANPVANQWAEVDLGQPRRIGKARIKQNSDGTHSARTFKIQSSEDEVTWVDRYSRTDSAIWGDLTVTFTPATSRYWRVLALTGGTGGWEIFTIEMYPVTTVGEGNPVRLAAPAERRVLAFDVAAGTPGWLAPAAANADTSGATLVQLEAEVNQLKALLRSAGLLSS